MQLKAHYFVPFNIQIILNAPCSDYFHGTSWNLDGYSSLDVLLLLVLQIVLHQVNDYKNTIYKK